MEGETGAKTEGENAVLRRGHGVVGIDPGESGGVAWVLRGELVGYARMPTLLVGKRKIINARSLTGWLMSAQHRLGVRPRKAVIEQVNAMPRQGLSSTFNFGRYAGAVEAWALLDVGRIDYVTPVKWKRMVGIPSGAPKKASLDRARLTFGTGPGRPEWSIKANDGIAEAALIADAFDREDG